MKPVISVDELEWQPHPKGTRHRIFGVGEDLLLYDVSWLALIRREAWKEGLVRRSTGRSGCWRTPLPLFSGRGKGGST